jgi:hypothetical protein
MSARRLLVAAGIALVAGAGPARAQRPLAPLIPFASGAIVDNRVRVGGAEAERASGSVWGIGASGRISDWLSGEAHLAGGTLTGRAGGAEERGYSEFRLAAILTPDSWLTVEAGPVIRVLESSLVRQRWSEMRIGSEFMIGLLDDRLRGRVRTSVAPVVSVTGQSSPDLALGAGTGLEYAAGRFSAALDFDFDRYDFPRGPTGRRLEQRTVLTAKVGWRVR